MQLEWKIRSQHIHYFQLEIKLYGYIRVSRLNIPFTRLLTALRYICTIRPVVTPCIIHNGYMCVSIVHSQHSHMMANIALACSSTWAANKLLSNAHSTLKSVYIWQRLGIDQRLHRSSPKRLSYASCFVFMHRFIWTEEQLARRTVRRENRYLHINTPSIPECW